MTPDLISPLNADAEMQSHYSSNPCCATCWLLRRMSDWGWMALLPCP